MKPTTYKIETWQDEDGWFLARITTSDIKGYGSCMTQGKDEEDLWKMISDVVLTMNDVKLSWWYRLLNRLRRY